MASRSQIAALLASQGGQFSPVKKRGYLLPIGQNQKGKTVPAVPQFVYDIGAALAAPGKVMRNPGLMINPETGRTSDYAIGRSADLAGMMTLGSGAIPADKNSLRMGIKAYHGSPHDFDRFSMDKIGTGEGAQAYGHGLYFADSEDVAKSYRNNLSGSTIDGVPAKEISGARAPSADDAFIASVLAHERTPEQARFRLDRLNRLDLVEKLDEMVAAGRVKPQGRMYEVNIDANPDDFLDWDRPLPMDHPLREKLAELGMQKIGAINAQDRNAGKNIFLAARNQDLTGAAAHDSLTRAIQPDAAQNADGAALAWGGGPNRDAGKVLATEELKKMGTPGIKYLDEGSRNQAVQPYYNIVRESDGTVVQQKMARGAAPNVGEGFRAEGPIDPRTRNYVVFDDKLISIVKKYGVAALVAAGVLDQAQGEELKARGYN
jgi:hypothetical protein